MELIEIKGDVAFYKNEKGKLYQQVCFSPLYPVRDGKITYKAIRTINKNTIKYNNNGVHGFSIFRGGKIMEDNIWVYSDAERIAKELK